MLDSFWCSDNKGESSYFFPSMSALFGTEQRGKGPEQVCAQSLPSQEFLGNEWPWSAIPWHTVIVFTKWKAMCIKCFYKVKQVSI